MMPFIMQMPSNNSSGNKKYYRRRKKRGKVMTKTQKKQLSALKKLRSHFASLKRLKIDPVGDGVSNKERAMARMLFGTTDDLKGLGSNVKLARNAFNWKGQGDYKTALKYLSRGIGGLAGGALGFMSGGFAGAAAGAKGGWDSGAGFSKWAGWGDYGPISTNQIMGGGSGPMQTATVNRGLSGDIIIQNSEFLGNVSATASGAGTSGFQLTKYPINAGLAGTFPFLSQLAQNYQLYQFMGLIFQYKPTSGEGNSVNANAIGKVIMATQYDPDALDFIDSIQMENYEWSNASKPSCGMLHGVETLPSQKATNQLYIRTGASQKNKIFTDIGNFYIATEGIPFNAAGTVNCGELWVTYTIKLSRANLYGSLLGYNIPIFWEQRINNVVTENSQNTLDCTVVADFNVGLAQLYYDITFPANISLGYFSVAVDSEKGFGSNAINGAPTVTNLVNCTRVSPSTSSTQQTHDGSDCTAAVSTVWVQVNAPGNSQASLRFVFQCTGGIFVSGAENWTVMVQGSNGIVYQNPV